MGTSLTGLTPSTTYDALIKVGDNGPLSATAKVLSDGLGNDSPIAMSTTLVGVGTSTPNRTLSVNGIVGVASASANTQQLLLSIDSVGSYITSSYFGSSSYVPMFLEAGGSVRLAITTAGNVGIATTTPTQKLAVDGNIKLQSSTATSKSIIFDSPASSWGPQESKITFTPLDGVNAATDISINLWDGLGAINETLKFPASGGIRFPSTQISSSNSNTLDDYEEGTFTPSVAFGGASTGITYFDRQGNYTKIGRQVTCTMYIAMTNVGSSTGIATIEGLPFTCNNLNRGSVSAIAIRYDNITSTGQLMGNVVQGSTQIGLSSTSVLGADTALNNTNFNASSEFNAITVTYFV